MEGHHHHPHFKHHAPQNLDRFERANRPIKILTYNVFMRPVIGDNTDLKDERAIHIKEAIKNYDIVCFQELFPHFNNRRDDMIKFAHTCFFKYASVPPGPGFFAMLTGSLLNSGLLTLSKFPIVVTEFIEFKSKAGVDSLAIKGVLYSKIKFPNHHHVHIFNTHLQATYNRDYQPDNKDDHKNFLARLKQIAELRDAVEKCLKSHSSYSSENPENFKDMVVVLGDFNVNSNGIPLPTDNFKELGWVKNIKTETFREYDYLTGVLSKNGQDKLVDLAYEGLGYHPVTYADSKQHEDGTHSPKEIHLTEPSEYMSMQCLDYIFQLHPFTHPGFNLKFALCPTTCKVNEFQVRDDQFSQLSDHYALECSFLVRPP